MAVSVSKLTIKPCHSCNQPKAEFTITLGNLTTRIYLCRKCFESLQIELAKARVRPMA